MGHRLSKEQHMQQEQNSKSNELVNSVKKEEFIKENNQNHLKLLTHNLPSSLSSSSSSSPGSGSSSASLTPSSSIATATAAAATSVIIIIRMLKMESNDCNKESTTSNCTTDQNSILSNSNDVCCANTTDIDSSNITNTSTTTTTTTNELLTSTHNQNVQKNLNLNNSNEKNIIITNINNHNNNISSCNSINNSLNLHSKNLKFCDTKNHIYSSNSNNNNNNNPNENNKIINNNFSDNDMNGLNVNLISETNYKKTLKEQQKHQPVVYVEHDPIQSRQQRSMATDDSLEKLTSMQLLQSPPQQQQSINAYHTMEPILKTKVKKSNNWKLNCAKLKSCKSSSISSNSPPILSLESLQNNVDESLPPHSSSSSVASNCDSFMNTSHTTIQSINNIKSTAAASVADNNKTRSQNQLIDFSRFNIDNFPIEDCDKTARIQRALEIAEGVEPPPGFQPSKISETATIIPITTTTPSKRENIAGNVNCSTVSAASAVAGLSSSLNADMLNTIQVNNDNGSGNSLIGTTSNNKTNSINDVKNNEIVLNNHVGNINSGLITSDSTIRIMLPPVVQEISLFETTEPPKMIIHSQVDYIHCLVPDLKLITNCSFYWGKMDRYEAERLLEGKPEGTFLLRDSAQEEFLFSVSFRKYGRSLHARIEQFNHKFSFDCHDPGVYTSPTVTGLLEHYKDPACVMFFEPALTLPLNRNFCFSLQQLCRATIVSHTSYDGVANLMLPKMLKSYLKEYHYRQRVRIKRYDDPIYNNS